MKSSLEGAHYSELSYLVQMAIARAASAAVSAAAEQYTFVVDPLGVAGKNVYTNLATAAAARRLVDGPALVEIRNPVAAPAAVYDFRSKSGAWDTTFYGVPSGAPGATPLSFAATSSLIGVRDFGLIALTWADAANPLLSPPDGTAISLVNGTTVAGGGLFLRALNAVASGVNVILYGASAIAAGTTMDTQGAGSFLVPVVCDRAKIGANCLVAGAGAVVFAVESSPGADIARVQAGVPGGTLVLGTNLIVDALTFANSSITSIVIDPTATVDGNVVQTLAQAALLGNRVPGNVKYIFRGNQTVAALPYNLAPLGGGFTYFEGSLSGNITTAGGETVVTWADGATITGGFPIEMKRLKMIVAAVATPVIEATAGNAPSGYRCDLYGCFFAPTGGAAFFRANGTPFMKFGSYDLTAYSGALAPTFEVVNAASQLDVVVDTSGFIGANVLRQTAGTLNAIATASSAISTTQIGAVTLFVKIQSFAVTLGAGGVSAAIPAIITASSVIECSLNTPVGAGDVSTMYSALGGGRTVGSVTGALGSFIVTGLATAGGAAVAGAAGTVVDVTVTN